MPFSDSSLAWFAGFFEGEGSVATHGSGIRIQIYQKDRWALDRCKELFGGYIVGPFAITRSKTYAHAWHLPNEDAYKLLLAIANMLSPRRQQQILVVVEHFSRRMR